MPLDETQKSDIRKVWSKAFEDLKKLKQNEFHQRFTPRQMAGLYAVASICYDEGNHSPLIDDIVFDRLCKWLYRNFDKCVKAGADKLDRELLRCCSGFDTKIFVKPYHEVAEVFLGHPCYCVKCKRESHIVVDRDSIT